LTIPEHVDSLRILIRQISDDTIFEDQFLYRKLLDARAFVLNNELNKFKHISKWNFQTFCVPLVRGSYDDCDCAPNTNCEVLRSTLEMPKPLRSSFHEYFSVSKTLTGDEPITPSSPLKETLRKYTKTAKKKLGWDINNKFLIIFNNTVLEYVFVRELLEDPTEAAEFCNTATCYDPDTDEFPMDAKLNDSVYKRVLELLGITLQMPEDITNNARSPISEKLYEVRKSNS